MGSINPIGSEAALSTLTKNSKSEKKSEKEKPKSAAEFSAETNAVVLDASLGTRISEEAKAREPGSQNGDLRNLYGSLSLTGKEIVDKIIEQLRIELPEGVQSLKPEDVTPEATASRIVTGVTAFFDQYAKQNKGLEGDALVESFLTQVQTGVDRGYGEAVKILEAIGAFEVDGVKSGIESTRFLIDEKLSAFATTKKQELSGEPALKPAQETPAKISTVA